jgi:hypothetical protein
MSNSHKSDESEPKPWDALTLAERRIVSRRVDDAIHVALIELSGADYDGDRNPDPIDPDWTDEMIEYANELLESMTWKFDVPFSMERCPTCKHNLNYKIDPCPYHCEPDPNDDQCWTESPAVGK